MYTIELWVDRSDTRLLTLTLPFSIAFSFCTPNTLEFSVRPRSVCHTQSVRDIRYFVWYIPFCTVASNYIYFLLLPDLPGVSCKTNACEIALWFDSNKIILFNFSFHRTLFAIFSSECSCTRWLRNIFPRSFEPHFSFIKFQSNGYIYLSHWSKQLAWLIKKRQPFWRWFRTWFSRWKFDKQIFVDVKKGKFRMYSKCGIDTRSV